MTEDPKLLPQEEATYAEPILMPTLNKTLTLTSSNIVSQQQQQQQQQQNLNGGNGGYSTATSPKATLRKVANQHGNNVGALFETSPSPCPSSGLYAPYSDAGERVGAGAINGGGGGGGGNSIYGRDPYSSFRSRDPFSGSMRSRDGYATNQPPPPPAPNDIAPFGTLRSSHNKNLANNSHLGDGYSTARSVKKVYL